MVLYLLPLFVFITIIIFYVNDTEYGNGNSNLLSILLKHASVSCNTKFYHSIRLIIDLLTKRKSRVLSWLNPSSTIVQKEVYNYFLKIKDVLHVFKDTETKKRIDDIIN